MSHTRLLAFVSLFHSSVALPDLDSIVIPNADNARSYITLPTELADHPGLHVEWTSSHPHVVSDKANGSITAGVVKRPNPEVTVTLTACITVHWKSCREISVTRLPSTKLARFSRYGMANFARSNSQLGQQMYFA